MPAVIDHDARRNALAEIAADIVATGGAEAATVRAVAAAAGFSTKAVTHYFPDKRALMLLTYRHAALTSKARTKASQPQNRGDLGALYRALLPTKSHSDTRLAGVVLLLGPGNRRSRVRRRAARKDARLCGADRRSNGRRSRLCAHRSR